MGQRIVRPHPLMRGWAATSLWTKHRLSPSKSNRYTTHTHTHAHTHTHTHTHTHYSHMQHFQLLMQTLLLCRCEPSLLLLSQVANQAIDELHIWSEGAWQGGCGLVATFPTFDPPHRYTQCSVVYTRHERWDRTDTTA